MTEKVYSGLGNKIREFRARTKLSLADLGENIGVDRTYLSKLENGHERPSKQVINDLINSLPMTDVEAIQLWNLAGYRNYGAGLVVSEKELKFSRKEVVDAMGEVKSPTAEVLMTDTPIIYTDSIFVTKNPLGFGVVFEVAQTMGDQSKHRVVARIGMSSEHAQALSKVLQNTLETKSEKNKEKPIGFKTDQN